MEEPDDQDIEIQNNFYEAESMPLIKSHKIIILLRYGDF
jgi:hypothetical protein